MMFSNIRLVFIFYGGLGLLLLISIITSDFKDPTFFNQLYPSIGVKNWIGLMGALIGGSLLEVFGTATLLIPWILLRIALHYPKKNSLLTSCYYTFVIVFLLSIIHEIAIRYGFLRVNYSEYFLNNGYAGKLGFSWLNSYMDIGLVLLFLISMLILSIIRIQHILSPIPFFKGIFFAIKKIIKIFLFKKSSINSKDVSEKKKLIDLKGNSSLIENDH